ncbi:MAG: glycerate kinase [Deltaproteobacteria bacterium]|nr:glycerate kinase [Deltaproteobacteria bacterium]
MGETVEKGDLARLRSDAEAVFLAAIRRVDPYEAVKRFVRREGRRLLLGERPGSAGDLDLDAYQRVFVVGGGKATAPMARALEELAGDRITEGRINVKYGFSETLERTAIMEADHPVPDRSGVDGTRDIMDLLAQAGDRDLVISLISGGGSALLPQPAGRIRLEEKQAVTRKLLECGASIDEINAVRKHISGSKGGQMARAAAPATTVNLMLSDVVGDRMDVIASGPFVPDASTFQDAWHTLDRYGLLPDLPNAVREHLEQGRNGVIPDTPKAGDPAFERVTNLIIGSNIQALERAAQEAGSLGYAPLILSSMIEGETRDVAKVHAAIGREMLKTGRPLAPPACVISGGETTVTIRGKGRGGRNQEFGLAAALELAGLPSRIVLLSGGTDGNDGPTDAAGAVVDPTTVERGRASGLDAEAYLDDNDAYTFFSATGDLLMTGPTKTNVMDVRLVMVK